MFGTETQDPGDGGQTPGQRMMSFDDLFEERRRRLDRREQSTEIKQFATDLWDKWPWYYFNIQDLELKREQDEKSLTLTAHYTLVRLGWVYKSATGWLMFEAARRDYDPSALSKVSQICQNMIEFRKVEPAFDVSSYTWPYFLGDLNSLPSDMRQIILDGEATFSRLVAKFEAEQEITPTDPPPKEPVLSEVSDDLTGQALMLYRFLKGRQWTSYDTLRDQSGLWRNDELTGETILKALKRLQAKLNAVDTPVVLEIANTTRRAKLLNA